jgi:hypothetical protein
MFVQAKKGFEWAQPLVGLQGWVSTALFAGFVGCVIFTWSTPSGMFLRAMQSYQIKIQGPQFRAQGALDQGSCTLGFTR